MIIVELEIGKIESNRKSGNRKKSKNVRFRPKIDVLSSRTYLGRSGIVDLPGNF